MVATSTGDSIKTTQKEHGQNAETSFQNYSKTPLKIGPPEILKTPLKYRDNLMMTAGPSNMPDEVRTAGGAPNVSIMKREFTQVLDDVKAGLQYLFQTNNDWTFAVGGSGTVGMEAAFLNVLDDGDSVLVCRNGLWAARAVDFLDRLGFTTHEMVRPAGQVFTLDEITQGLEKYRPNVLFLVHSESATGVLHPLTGVGQACSRFNCLLVLDTVASLGAVPFSVDELQVDVAYSGSQKVLGASPGLSPITFSPAAVDKVKNRRTRVKSFSLDASLIADYWACIGGEDRQGGHIRPYHITPPTSTIYALRAALGIVAEETLEKMWERQAKATEALYQGLDELGLELFVSDPAIRLPTVTSVQLPQGLDWKLISRHADEQFSVDLAPGLGPTSGLVFRVGVMGHNARIGKVNLVLEALRSGIEFAKQHQ